MFRPNTKRFLSYCLLRRKAQSLTLFCYVNPFIGTFCANFIIGLKLRPHLLLPLNFLDPFVYDKKRWFAIDFSGLRGTKQRKSAEVDREPTLSFVTAFFTKLFWATRISQNLEVYFMNQRFFFWYPLSQNWSILSRLSPNQKSKIESSRAF